MLPERYFIGLGEYKLEEESTERKNKWNFY